jgi:hypothetical protein
MIIDVVNGMIPHSNLEHTSLKHTTSALHSSFEVCYVLKKEAVFFDWDLKFCCTYITLHCIVMAQWYEDPSLVLQSKASNS